MCTQADLTRLSLSMRQSGGARMSIPPIGRGVYEFCLRLTNPNIPCLAGVTPVKIDVQAEGEIGGIVERNPPHPPSLNRREKP